MVTLQYAYVHGMARRHVAAVAAVAPGSAIVRPHHLAARARVGVVVPNRAPDDMNGRGPFEIRNSKLDTLDPPPPTYAT